jgi:hypothetical protein
MFIELNLLLYFYEAAYTRLNDIFFEKFQEEHGAAAFELEAIAQAWRASVCVDVRSLSSISGAFLALITPILHSSTRNRPSLLLYNRGAGSFPPLPSPMRHVTLCFIVFCVHGCNRCAEDRHS